MRYLCFLLPLLFALSSCQEECMLECDFTGMVQVDTTWPIPHQLWIIGADSVELIYIDTLNGDSTVFEVVDYSFDISEELDTVPCGECGDSVLAKKVTPHFRYEIRNEDNLSIIIEMNSDRVINEPNRLLQCVDGSVTFINDGTMARTIRFIFDCNSVFDPEDAFLIINETYGHRRAGRDSLVGNCMVDSLDYFFLEPASDVPLFTLSREVPVRLFEFNDQCWRYDTIRVK